jgi:hypothetical protein
MSFVLHPSAFPAYAVRPAVGDPVPIVPQARVPRAVDPQAAIPRVASRLVLSVRTSTEVARSDLRDAIGALGGTPASSSADGTRNVHPCEAGGGPLAIAEPPVTRVRFPRRPGPGAQPPSSPRDAAYAALATYARALRHDGMLLPAALATVGAVVDDAADSEAAGLLAPALLAAVQRDATQCCRTVFAAA